MPASSPQALALGEPAAVLLLLPGGTLLAADAGARGLAGGRGLPRTLEDFRVAAGLPRRPSGRPPPRAGRPR